MNCASIQAMQPVPGFSGYASTKTGLLGLTRVAALEGAKQKIRVNCICPGFTEHTALSDNFLASFEGARERVDLHHPHRADGHPRGYGRDGPLAVFRRGLVSHRSDHPRGRGDEPRAGPLAGSAECTETERKLVEFVSGTGFDDIPPDALEIVKDQVLSIVGTTIAGA